MADHIEDLTETNTPQGFKEEVPPVYYSSEYLFSGHTTSSAQPMHLMPPGLTPITGHLCVDPAFVHQTGSYYTPAFAHTLSPMTGSLTNSTGALATVPLDSSVPSSVGADFPAQDTLHHPTYAATPVSSMTSGVSPPHNIHPNPNSVPVSMPISVPMAPVGSPPPMIYTMQYPTHQFHNSLPSLVHGSPGSPYCFSCPPFPYSHGSLPGQSSMTQQVPVASSAPLYFTPHTTLPMSYSSPVLPTHSFSTSKSYLTDTYNNGKSSLSATAATTTTTMPGTRRNAGRERSSIFQERAKVSISTRRNEPPEVSSKDAAEAKKAELIRAGPQAAISYMKENEKHIEVLMMSPCGNHLLQALIKLSPDVIGPIILNSTTYSEDTFRMIIKGKCSCWVLQAIFSSGYIHDKAFEDLLVKHHEEIAKSEYGNFVLQRAIECPQFQSFDALSKHLLLSFQSICSCKYGSHVAECLIKTLASRNKLDDAAYWLFMQPYFYSLIIDQHGCFVVEKIAEVSAGDVKICCLRIVKHVINTLSPGSHLGEAAALLGITQKLSPSLIESINSILHSVKLRCKTINKSFESMAPMSQDDLSAFLKDHNISVIGPSI